MGAGAPCAMGAENSGGINVGGVGSWGGRGGCVCVVGAAVFFLGEAAHGARQLVGSSPISLR